MADGRVACLRLVDFYDVPPVIPAQGRESRRLALGD